MKLFKEPVVEVITFAVEDVVTTSFGSEEPPAIGGMLDTMSCVS